jgi:hypothetical protein
MNFDLFVEKTLKRLSAGMTIADIAKKHNKPVSQIKAQVKKGTKVEKEHGKPAKEAKQIAMDHEVENPKYYTKLSKAKL